ncbi:GIY-YIG nuclease family protein [Micromonospora chersina]|uniref:GIY-YIG nuclease family protein n=1 Tax=Micromonospora chersina TaxID=47854 RepID=UPI0036C6CBF7
MDLPRRSRSPPSCWHRRRRHRDLLSPDHCAGSRAYARGPYNSPASHRGARICRWLRLEVRNQLRRSGSSTLRRTLAGLPVCEGYLTTWTDRVVPEDEARLTTWMYAHVRLSWVEDAEWATIEAQLVRRVHTPLNVHGVNPEHIQAGPGRRQDSYNISSRPAESSRTP